ncbi:MAG: Gfo/Idh/MocA family oxidoreductase [Thermodesulfobacteriota bacterium]
MGFKDVTMLIVGCGSIGARHATNLATLGVGKVVLCDPNPERTKELASKLSGVETGTVKSIEEALKGKKKPNAAVIATPSSMHVEHAALCASSGVDVLIEKPLSNTLDNVVNLINTASEKKVMVMMAMCYRFHPVFLRLKEIIEESILGDIYHVNYFGGHYLPDWHPDVDYRDEYAARSDLGGGVVLTSIHGLDNIRWLFGDVLEVASFVDTVSDLDMDVEDMVASIMKTEKAIHISMYSDFLNRKGQHLMHVTASLGSIECDFISGTIKRFTANNGETTTETVDYDVNTMYLGEMEYFLKSIEEGDEPVPGLHDGVMTLKLAMALKESSDARKFILL